MKPFNLEEALAGKPVVTRHGRKVTGIYHFDKAKTIFRVIAQIEGEYGLQSYSPDGRWKDNKESDDLDLFMDATYKYFNVYHNGTEAWCGKFCDTMEEVEDRKDMVSNDTKFITTIKIEL